jgi:hypothetical protein
VQNDIGGRLSGQVEKPRSEPEIIARDDEGTRSERMHAFSGTGRIYFVKPSPLGFILVVLTTAILSAAMLVLLFGAFLFLAPIVVLFVAGMIIAGFLRGYFQHTH